MEFCETSFPVKDGERIMARVYLRRNGAGTFQPGVTLGAQLARRSNDVMWLSVYGRAQACADYAADYAADARSLTSKGPDRRATRESRDTLREGRLGHE